MTAEFSQLNKILYKFQNLSFSLVYEQRNLSELGETTKSRIYALGNYF